MQLPSSDLQWVYVYFWDVCTSKCLLHFKAVSNWCVPDQVVYAPVSCDWKKIL